MYFTPSSSPSQTLIATSARYRWYVSHLYQGFHDWFSDKAQKTQELQVSSQELLQRLPPPDTLPDIHQAAERILEALHKEELIAIFADYDVDGISASAMLRAFFREIEVKTITYIPDRLIEGYGLNPTGVAHLAKQGAKLIITVDNGIAACEAISLAKRLGIDVIVTDHHDIPKELPKDAYALVNPKLTSSHFPYPHLAGVGVAFYLLAALRQKARSIQPTTALAARISRVNLKTYLDYVALGSIADIVPLTGVNYIFCKIGLEVLKENILKGFRPGIAALFKYTQWDFKSPLTSHDIAFGIAPLLNASGRLKHAYLAEELLHISHTQKALELAESLHAENVARKKLEQETLREALEEINKRSKPPTAIVLGKAHWHPGIVGLVAARLAEIFSCPTLIAGGTPQGLWRGSGRSIPAINLFTALSQVQHYFEGFGGHHHAVGFTLLPEEEKLLNLQKYLEDYVQNNTTPEQRISPLHIDSLLKIDDIILDNFELLQQLEPFGIGNPRPRWLMRHLRIKQIRKTDSGSIRSYAGVLFEAHLGQAFWAKSFGLVDLLERLQKNEAQVSIVCEGRIENWQGKRHVTIQVIDCIEDNQCYC